jgi:hypothetical protein
VVTPFVRTKKEKESILIMTATARTATFFLLGYPPFVVSLLAAAGVPAGENTWGTPDHDKGNGVFRAVGQQKPQSGETIILFGIPSWRCRDPFGPLSHFVFVKMITCAE